MLANLFVSDEPRIVRTRDTCKYVLRDTLEFVDGTPCVTFADVSKQTRGVMIATRPVLARQQKMSLTVVTHRGGTFTNLDACR